MALSSSLNPRITVRRSAAISEIPTDISLKWDSPSEYSLKGDAAHVLKGLSGSALPSSGEFRPAQKVLDTEERGAPSSVGLESKSILVQGVSNCWRRITARSCRA